MAEISEYDESESAVTPVAGLEKTLNESFSCAWSDSRNDSIVCYDLKYYNLAATVVLAAVIGVVAVVTIAGNMLVVAAFATDRKLRSFGNYFILNLAISDLIVGLLICVYAPYLLRGCWQLTRAGCLVFLLLDYVVPLASAWNMALISLDHHRRFVLKLRSPSIFYGKK